MLDIPSLEQRVLCPLSLGIVEVLLRKMNWLEKILGSIMRHLEQRRTRMCSFQRVSVHHRVSILLR